MGSGQAIKLNISSLLWSLFSSLAQSPASFASSPAPGTLDPFYFSFQHSSLSTVHGTFRKRPFSHRIHSWSSLACKSITILIPLLFQYILIPYLFTDILLDGVICRVNRFLTVNPSSQRQRQVNKRPEILTQWVKSHSEIFVRLWFCYCFVIVYTCWTSSNCLANFEANQDWYAFKKIYIDTLTHWEADAERGEQGRLV